MDEHQIVHRFVGGPRAVEFHHRLQPRFAAQHFVVGTFDADVERIAAIFRFAEVADGAPRHHPEGAVAVELRHGDEATPHLPEVEQRKLLDLRHFGVGNFLLQRNELTAVTPLLNQVFFVGTRRIALHHLFG